MILYKYVPLNLDRDESKPFGNRTYAHKILTDLKIKVTPPNEFNDPFELTPNSQFTYTPEQMIARVRNDPEYFRASFEELQKAGFTRSFEEVLAVLPHSIPDWFKTKRFKRYMTAALIQRDLRAVHEASEDIGILCLSEPNDSIPMWSYYSQDHRGIAYGIHVDNRCFNDGNIDRVDYQRKRCPVDPNVKEGSAESLAQMTKVLFTKSKVWKHEEEHRFIFMLRDLVKKDVPNGNPLYFVNIDSEAVQEIIFGCRVDPRLEALIRKEIDKGGMKFRHIDLFRCKLHPTRFKLDVVPA